MRVADSTRMYYYFLLLFVFLCFAFCICLFPFSSNKKGEKKKKGGGRLCLCVCKRVPGSVTHSGLNPLHSIFAYICISPLIVLIFMLVPPSFPSTILNEVHVVLPYLPRTNFSLIIEYIYLFFFEKQNIILLSREDKLKLKDHHPPLFATIHYSHFISHSFSFFFLLLFIHFQDL